MSSDTNAAAALLLATSLDPTVIAPAAAPLLAALRIGMGFFDLLHRFVS